MTRPRVRLRDVAVAADTSAKTASRVINGDPRVAAETRARVEQAVRDLGYQPDPLARSLRRGTDDTIGVVIDSVADPFFASVTGEIERLALDFCIRTDADARCSPNMHELHGEQSYGPVGYCGPHSEP